MPVRPIPATEPKDVRFHLYDRSGRRVRYERVVEGSEPAEPAGPQAFGLDEAEPETGAATSSPQPNASDTPSAEPAAPAPSRSPGSLDALGPAPRAELLHVPMLPDVDRADQIGSLGEPSDLHLRRAADRR